MTRYNNLSILRRIALDDLTSLRRIISCLKSANFDTCSISPDIVRRCKLTGTETAWVDHVLKIVLRTKVVYPLLKEALLRFVDTRLRDDETVLVAATDLENVAEERVLNVPERHFDEYEEAYEKFNEKFMVHSVEVCRFASQTN